MSLKRIVVIATGDAGDQEALAAGAELALACHATTEVLPMYPDPAVDMIALGMALGATVPKDAVEQLAATERLLLRRIDEQAWGAAQATDVVYGHGLGGPRMFMLPRGVRPALELSQTIGLADLVVLGQGYVSGAGRHGEVLGQVLLYDRCPVLIARGAFSQPDVAVIAWDGSGPACRAVKAALPLLGEATAIKILQCRKGLNPLADDPSIDRLNDYLRLHGLGAGEPVVLDGDEREALIGEAKRQKADLFIAGAYGHSRLREAVFGGATRSFLQDDTGPHLLLAH